MNQASLSRGKHVTKETSLPHGMLAVDKRNLWGYWASFLCDASVALRWKWLLVSALEAPQVAGTCLSFAVPSSLADCPDLDKSIHNRPVATLRSLAEIIVLRCLCAR